MLSIKKICGNTMEVEGNMEVDIPLAIEILKVFQNYQDNPSVIDVTPWGVGVSAKPAGSTYVFAICKIVAPDAAVPLKMFWDRAVAERYLVDLGLPGTKLLAYAVE